MSRNHVRLHARRWARVRRAVLRRDRFRCQSCGRAGRLECDHIVPLDKGAPWDTTISDETGYPRETVRKALRWLRREGWIEAEARRRTDGEQTSNGYWITGEPADRISGQP